jgi:hypothetical protein
MACTTPVKATIARPTVAQSIRRGQPYLRRTDGMRLMLAATIVAFATDIAFAVPAIAQSDLPCDSFVRHADGKWSSTKPLKITRGNGISVDIGPGRSFGSGVSFSGLPLAEMLEIQCRGISAEIS